MTAAHPSALPIGDYTEDECLLRATGEDGEPRSRVYRPYRVAVVLGRGSQPERELHLAACIEDGVPLLRRRGGGCAVVLDPGNLVISVALRVQGIGQNLTHFDRLSRWIAAALERLGIVSVERRGHSDLALGDRKVGGACIYRGRDLLFYSATLLVEPDLKLLDRYLQHPPREPAYRLGRRHGEFVRSLLDGPRSGDAMRLEKALQAELRVSEI